MKNQLLGPSSVRIYRCYRNYPQKSFLLLSILVLFIISACSKQKNPESKIDEQFTIELNQLKDYFKIPGISALIEQDGQIIYENYFGLSDIESNTKTDAATVFPIASLTKVFSGVLLMKLAEQSIISLDDPANKYLENTSLNDSILIKHLLSHTSQGPIGEQFYYSFRFGALTKIIEKATNQSFAALLQKEIFNPLDLNNTFLLKDSTQVLTLQNQFASPYILDNGIEKGRIEYGYSTSAGIVSNTKDLLTFSRALDENMLIKVASKNKMFTPFREGLPYGYGIFSQKLYGFKTVWAYGQYDCYAALFIKIPSKKITLILLANNNLMSDPARLIYGNLSSSLFAMSFLKNYILNIPEEPLFQNPENIKASANQETTFSRDIILAQALAESFMARFDVSKINSSAALLEYAFKLDPDYLDYANLSLLHNLSFLKDVAFYRDLDEFKKFDEQIESISTALLKETPQNPYIHNYLGVYNDRKGNIEKAKFHFQKIVNAENFSKNWYTVEAENWLKTQ